MSVLLGMVYTPGMDTYYQTIPFMFYPMAALFVVFMFAMGWLPKLGPMKNAYERMKVSQQKAREMIENPQDSVSEPKEEGNVMDFIVPMAVLFCVTIYTSDMFIAIICTLASCMLLLITSRML